MEQYGSDFDSSISRRIINTPSPSAKSTFFYIQEAGFIKAEDGSAAQRKDLDSFLFAVVIKGRGALEFGEDRYSLNGGDCVFIDCRIPFNMESSETEPWELMWIRFNGATSGKYYEFFLTHLKNVFKPASTEKIISVIAEIIRINEMRSANAEILTSGLIMNLLTYILTMNDCDEQVDSTLRQKLSAVNSYIEEHFTEEITLEKLASTFYISKYYLTREYKKIYGKTIFQHIITCRINCGKKLLRFSDKSVEEIAHLCGFNDQSYFARQFKKSENVTCFAYRKMWRDQ